ncbi:hypothetical protein E2986_11101 [Frieseomelitta varia]|uniref:Uncharacterized protein n=1 Tax=Frieseomelitta varia TaxID=561572 RepID=A0A833SCA9_9HYME|nr:hypothetical protein E2986_11101 [Frieseomelitta varia]
MSLWNHVYQLHRPLRFSVRKKRKTRQTPGPEWPTEALTAYQIGGTRTWMLEYPKIPESEEDEQKSVGKRPLKATTCYYVILRDEREDSHESHSVGLSCTTHTMYLGSLPANVQILFHESLYRRYIRCIEIKERKSGFFAFHRVRSNKNLMCHLIIWKVFNVHSDSRQWYENPRVSLSESWRLPINQYDAKGFLILKVNVVFFFLFFSYMRVITISESDNIVFPDTNVKSMRMETAPSCQEQTFCEDVPNYPSNLVKEIISKNPHLKNYKTVDMVIGNI